jgi:hypothetical protein
MIQQILLEYLYDFSPKVQISLPQMVLVVGKIVYNIWEKG